jgi:hypothetical protein
MPYNGNNLFASINVLEGNIPSRKDDLISICYMYLMLINKGVLPLLGLSSDADKNFKIIKTYKKRYRIQAILDKSN